MKTKNVNNAIEDWLGGRTDRAGSEWLAGEMKKDPELAREVNLRRKTDEIIADRQVMELRNKLSVIGRKKRAAAPLRGIVMNSARYAAAVALIAVISTAIYLEMRPDASPEKLYASNYDRYESPGAVRSASGEGNALMELGWVEGALDCYNRSLAREPSIAETWNAKGVALTALGRYDVALDSFNESLMINSNYGEAWGNKGLVLKSLGRTKEAEIAFSRSGADCPACAAG